MKKTLTTTFLILLSILIYAQNGKKDKFNRDLYNGKYTNKDFFEKADYIFEGEYIKSESYMLEGKIYTQYYLKVLEIYKGDKNLKQGTVSLIKNSGYYTKAYIDEFGMPGESINEQNTSGDYDILGKSVFFCIESDFPQSPIKFESTNIKTLRLLQNYEHASFTFYDEEEDIYNFLIAGLDNLYFKDKQAFYNYAKQFKGIKIPKYKKKENQEELLNEFMKKQYSLLEIAKKNDKNKTKTDNTLTLTIGNQEVTGEDTAYFEFDVMASSNNNLYYDNSLIRLDFNTNLFGSDLVLNDNIELNISSNIDTTTYQTKAFDNAIDNRVTLALIVKDSLSQWNRTLLTSTAKALFHVKIKIQNQLPVKTEHYTNLTFSDIGFTSMFSTYTTSATSSTEDLDVNTYDNTNYINPENLLVKVEKPFISTELSKLHVIAGFDTLTIRGNFFGDEVGEVWFSDTETGGSSFIRTLDSSFVVNWTDTLISVKVPSYIDYGGFNSCAATGQIKIKTAVGRKGTSSSVLNVDYSISTHSFSNSNDTKRVYLAKRDCNNDIMFTLHSNIINIPNAASCIDSALNHWSLKTNIHIYLEKDVNGNYITVNTDNHSLKNVIWFDSARSYGMGTKKNIQVAYNTNLSDSVSYYRSFSNIGIAAKPVESVETVWNYNLTGAIPANQVSFYQAFLHEIGHFLGLYHVSDKNGLMYYKISADSPSQIIDLNSTSISNPDSAVIRVIQDSKNLIWSGKWVGTFGTANPAKPTIQASGDLISCLDSLKLTSNHTDDNTWYPNLEQTNSIVVSLNDDYALKVLKSGCTVYSDTITVKLKPQITRFMINNGAKSTGSTKVTLDNTCTNSPTDYLAYEEGNSGKWLAYYNNPYFNLSTSSGVKRVYLKVKRDNCESEEKSTTIWYSPKKSGGKNKYTNSDNIQIYPNPVQGNLIIEYFNNNEVKLEIIDFTGKTILQSIFEDKISIDFSKFQSGVYFIKIVENSTIHTKKFIKQ